MVRVSRGNKNKSGGRDSGGDGRGVGNVAYYFRAEFLYRGTTEREPLWQADLQKFRVHLKDKY